MRWFLRCWYHCRDVQFSHPVRSSGNSGEYAERLGFGLQGNRRVFIGAARTEDRAHRDAQFAEPPKMVPDQALPLDFCHWGTALFFVRGAPLQYKIGPGPRTGKSWAMATTALGPRLSDNPPELVSQMTVFLGSNTPSALAQRTS